MSGLMWQGVETSLHSFVIQAWDAPRLPLTLKLIPRLVTAFACDCVAIASGLASKAYAKSSTAYAHR